MENRPLITFVLLGYKQAQFVREAIEGAFAQTYSPLQIILSDDCSPDSTFEIMTEMAEGYDGPHEVLLNRNGENLGITRHVNKCFEMAKGEILVLAAGDDISFPERTEVIAKNFEENPDWTSVVSGGAVFGAESKLIFPFSQNRKLALIEACSQPLGPQGSCSAYRKEVYTKFPPLDENGRAEDIALTFRSALIGVHASISDVLVWYRASEGAVANRGDSLEQRLNLLELGFSAYEENLSDLDHFLASENKSAPISRLAKKLMLSHLKEQHRLMSEGRTTSLKGFVLSKLLSLPKLLRLVHLRHTLERRRIAIANGRRRGDVQPFHTRFDRPLFAKGEIAE